jgi:hypothetical protein
MNFYCLFIKFLKIALQAKISHRVRIKPTSVYKVCEFIMYVENLLHVSATFCDHLQGGVVGSVCYKEHKKTYKSKILKF